MGETGKRRLGASGLCVPALGVGTDSWGERLVGYGKRYDAISLYDAYRACLDGGLDFFDTAPGYGRGESERLIGSFRTRDGRPITIATKLDNPLPFSRRKPDPRTVVRAIDGSLARLGMDCIDLYQVHFPLPEDRLDEHMDVLADAVTAGKIRAVGVSNFSTALLRRAHAALARRRVPLASNQVAYNLLHRWPEANGLLETCRTLDVALIAYTPLALGILSGKYRHGAKKITLAQSMFFRAVQLDLCHEQLAPPRFRAMRLLVRPRQVRAKQLEPLFQAMAEVAASHHVAISQVALNWLLASAPQVIPIPGAKSAAQATANASTLNWQMSAAEHALLSRAEEATR